MQTNEKQAQEQNSSSNGRDAKQETQRQTPQRDSRYSGPRKVEVWNSEGTRYRSVWYDPQQRRTFVYFFQAGSIVKVGCSHNPKRRLIGINHVLRNYYGVDACNAPSWWREFETNCCRFLLIVRGDNEMEKAIRRKLNRLPQSKQLGREWVFYDDRLKDLLQRLERKQVPWKTVEREHFKSRHYQDVIRYERRGV